MLDFSNFSQPSPSSSQIESKNPENAMIKVELEPRDERQCKESIEIKDELAMDLENSKFLSDNQGWSKFTESQESGKPIDEDVDEAPKFSFKV